MSDALSQFISNLQTLDASNLSAPQNAAALAKFQSLDSGTQREVLNDLTSRHGASFDEFASLPDSAKHQVINNLKSNKPALDGVSRNAPAQTQSQPAIKAAPGQETFAASHNDFAKRHGEAAASNRFGYQNPTRQAQLDRISSMQEQAKREGKTFSQVADERVRAGK